MDDPAQNSQREPSIEGQRRNWDKPELAKARKLKPRLSLRAVEGKPISEASRGRVVSAIPLRDKDCPLEESLEDTKARRRNFREIFEAGIHR